MVRYFGGIGNVANKERCGSMKKVFLAYLCSGIFLGILFLVVVSQVESLSVVDGAFWFGIVLLLLAFFTKKDSSVMPFGLIRGVGGNDRNRMDMTIGNDMILTKGEIYRKRVENNFNNKNVGNSLCLIFFVYGVLFFVVSLVGSII